MIVGIVYRLRNERQAAAVPIGPGERMAKDTTTPAKGNGANLGFETELWKAAKGASCDWPN
jgi:hypothetical protein